MTSLHPNWNATDQDRPPETSNARVQHLPTVSRRPAAVVGIALVIGLGISFVKNIDTLRAQLKSPQSIRITDEGLLPPVITIEPGQEILWVNETAETPHIFTSETLETTDGLLYTAHILPGSDLTVTIAPGAQQGTHTYISLTAPDVSGQVIIAEKSAVETSSPVREDDAPPALATAQQRRLTPPAASPPQAPAQEPPAAVKGTIPRNPYTVEKGFVPLPITAPIPPIQAQVATAQLQGSPRPFTQPSTGPHIWVAGILSIGGIYFVIRRVMRRRI